MMVVMKQKIERPQKWDDILSVIKALGVPEHTWRKWLDRRHIPANWKFRILDECGGRLVRSDLVIPPKPDSP